MNPRRAPPPRSHHNRYLYMNLYHHDPVQQPHRHPVRSTLVVVVFVDHRRQLGNLKAFRSPAMSLRVAALAVAVVVLAAVTALPASSTSATPEEKHYKVGGPDGWRVPPPDVKEKYYANWASGITFYVGDSVEFVYKNDSVIKVDKAGYYHCTGTPPAGAAPRDGRKIFHLDAPGYAYFASADIDRCKMGERLMINVISAEDAPGPWPGHMPAQGPSSSTAAASSVRAIMPLLVVPVAVALAGLL